MGGARCFTVCSLYRKPSEISDFASTILLVGLSNYAQLISILMATHTDSRNAHAESSNTCTGSMQCCLRCLIVSANACVRPESSRLPSDEAPITIAENHNFLFSVRPVAVSKQELSVVPSSKP